MKYQNDMHDASVAERASAKAELSSIMKQPLRYKASDVLWEIEDRRTLTEKHFHMSDGTEIAVSYEQPVHYMSKNGKLEDIDNRLSLCQQDGTPVISTNVNELSADKLIYKNAAGLADVRLAESSGAEKLASISYGGYTVSLTPQAAVNSSVVRTASAYSNADTIKLCKETIGRLKQPETAIPKDCFEAKVMPQNLTSSVIYNNVFDQTSVEYVIGESSIKENIIIDAPMPTYEYRFIVEAEKLHPVMMDNGGIELKDENNSTIFVIPSGYMFDSDGNSSTEVEYVLEALENGKYLLRVIADAEWINADERTFPVTIDPPVFIQGFYNIETGTLNERYPNGHSGQKATEELGYYSGTGKNCRILVRVNNLPTLPDNSYVVNSSINLYEVAYSDIAMSSLRIQAQALNYNTPTEGYWSLYHTWNDCPPLGSVIDWADVYNKRQFYSWNVTREAIKWYNDPRQNYGICLKACKEGSMNSSSCANVGFASSNTTNAGARPYFVVQYRNCAGLEGYYCYQNHSIQRAGTGYIGDYSGQLTVVKNDLSAASTVNDAGISHVYNSMYSANEYSSFITGASGKYSGMKLGHGWMLDIQQIITAHDGGYLLYADGDGTIHYFSTDGDVYKDEDGLNLTITKSGNDYTLKDKKNNIRYFSNGMLSYHQDANGNRVNYVLNGSGQIVSVTRQNSGESLETIATLNYNSDGYLTTIIDPAGNTTSYSYDSSGRLTGITHPDGTTVTYDYNSNSKLTKAADNESGYSMNYEYNGITGKVSKFYECGTDSTGQVVGASVLVDGTYNGIQSYRHCGANRVLGDGDDIVSHHVLDYFGRTTSSYTTNADMTKIYGASSSAYTANSGTSANNNRVLASSTVGVQSINLLSDAGIENQSSVGAETAPWFFNGGGSAAIASDKVHTGFKAIKVTRSGSDNDSVIGQTVTGLTANGWYILSAYVNTANVTDFGEKGKVYIRSRESTVDEGVSVNWNSDGVNKGWERIYSVVQANASGSITLELVASGISGAVYLDDLQLEESVFGADGTPGPVSLLDDGAMTKQNVWKAWLSQYMSYTTDEKFGSVARLQGDAFECIDVYQDLQLNQPGTQTYLISGWAKASSVPMGGSADAREYDVWVQIYYDGETEPETQTAPFNVDNENWQYVSMPIVPKCPEKTVKWIRVFFTFGRNPNVGLFTDIAFSRQDAQSYKYNSDGELVSVTSSENEEQSFTYSGADIISQVTRGNGKYTYEYDNKHNMTKATNDGVSMSASYSTCGNTSGTTLSATGLADKIITSASYTYNGNLLSAQTDARGNVLRYEYSAPINKQTAQPSAITDALGVVRHAVYNNQNGRLEASDIENTVKLNYGYSKGQMCTMERTGGGKTQTYTMVYDSHGRIIENNVGNRKLASYTYGEKNGPMQSMTYGNGDSVNYEYDALERKTALRYNESKNPAASYAYTTDGTLGRVQDNISGRHCSFNYDALGRLITFVERKDGKGIQRMHAAYDNGGRLASTEYALSPGLSGKFGSARVYGYKYKDEDGSLTSMTLPGSAGFAYTYDALKRLTKRELSLNGTEVMKRELSYLPGDSADKTTLMVSELNNTRNGQIFSRFAYKYDAAGNIISIVESRVRKERRGEEIVGEYLNSDRNYEYDAQGQLVREHCYSRDPLTDDREAYSLCYNFDANGNLLSWGDANKPFVLSYEDAQWPDLLTAFNGKAISYDAIGNPLHWHDGTDFKWVHGRQLASAVNAGKGLEASYTYNVDGLRMSKTVNGVEHKYIWQGYRLLSESCGDTELEFFYDENGKPYSMSYKADANAEPVMYYYVTNLQGDIMSMVDAEGFSVAEYYYNAWGLPMGTLGALAEINPLRYRGYYFDTETGLYYLKGRYYDPFVCRFINADNYQSTGQDILGTNMFAYCNNNPMMYVDSNGDFPWAIFLTATLVGGLIGGLVGAAYGAINAYAAGEDVGIGARYGFIAGLSIGTVLSGGPLIKCIGKVGTVLINTVIAVSLDYKAQKAQFNKKLENCTVSGEFKPDYGSMIMAATFSAGGTLLGFGLTISDTVMEAVATGLTGGLYATLATATLEMSTRYLYGNKKQETKSVGKSKKAPPYSSRWEREIIMMW